MTRLDVLVESVQQFRDKHIPDQSVTAAAAKLAHEAAELAQKPGDLVEGADVLITLIGWCETNDLLFSELVEIAIHKMAINAVRKWTINADGTAQHVDV